MYIFNVTTLHMQNSTPPVKAETCCSINQQTKSVVQKVGVQCYISDNSVQATLPAGLCPRMQTAVWQANQMHCQLCSAVTLHCVLLSQFNIQIQNTATTPSPSQLGMISAGDQLAIHNTAPSSLFWPQYHSTGTDSLLQSARFTVWYSAPERLHTSPGMHALNKQTQKKKSETGKAEEKLHSSFNKWTGFSQNCNSERGQLAELLPNSDKHVQFSGDSAKREDYSFLLA